MSEPTVASIEGAFPAGTYKIERVHAYRAGFYFCSYSADNPNCENAMIVIDGSGSAQISGLILVVVGQDGEKLEDKCAERALNHADWRFDRVLEQADQKKVLLLCGTELCSDLVLSIVLPGIKSAPVRPASSPEKRKETKVIIKYFTRPQRNGWSVLYGKVFNALPGGVGEYEYGAIEPRKNEIIFGFAGFTREYENNEELAIEAGRACGLGSFEGIIRGVGTLVITDGPEGRVANFVGRDDVATGGLCAFVPDEEMAAVLKEVLDAGRVEANGAMPLPKTDRVCCGRCCKAPQ